MRMFLWDITSPMRDGALENDIVAHENTHGISNRLTGGGTGRCLQTTEAGGMGEGWSDAFVTFFGSRQEAAAVAKAFDLARPALLLGHDALVPLQRWRAQSCRCR